MDPVAETTALLTMLIRAMVSDRAAVTVTPAPDAVNGTIFKVRVALKDKGKLIGRNGRTARSLRLILLSIGRENGGNYLLDLEGVSAEPEDR